MLEVDNELCRFPTITTNEMLRAVQTRQRQFDGVFYYAVKTTGVFCVPSCVARKPNPVNIEFFQQARQAAASGYRPCNRCRPLDRGAHTPNWFEGLTKILTENASSTMTDADLRAHRIDPVQARRWCVSNYGLTWQRMRRFLQLSSAVRRIRKGATLTTVISTSGYRSESAFRQACTENFNAAPKRLANADHFLAREFASPVGQIMLVANDKELCGLRFLDHHPLAAALVQFAAREKTPASVGSNAIIAAATVQLREYFAGERQAFDLPLRFLGTDFQQTTWKSSMGIPYGETVSYGKLAEMVGRPNAYRAVGNANGANKIAIIIPCHRVIAAGGKLGGYGGALWRKQALLELERETSERA